MEKEKTRNGEIYKTTNNRSVYNKARKQYLEKYGKIRCAHCKYHKGENSTEKWYGGFKKNDLKYPSWKETNKCKHQWQKKKPIIKEFRVIRSYTDYVYYDVIS